MQPNMGNAEQNVTTPMIMGQQMQDCINDCLNCHNVCMDHAMSALNKGGKAGHIGTLLDCAEICLATAHSMMRNSELYGYFCTACARICTHCAGVCATMGDRDSANACNACAASCQQMIKMVS